MSIDAPVVTQCQIMVDPTNGQPSTVCANTTGNVEDKTPVWTVCPAGDTQCIFAPIDPHRPTLICLVDEHGAVVTIRDYSGIAVRLCVPRNLLK